MATDKKVSEANPATGKLTLPKGYRPMSVGQRRLEVPAIDGYHLHWFRGNPANLSRAHQAGYEFVEQDEVSLNDFDLAGGDGDKGSDMGSRVSVTTGDDITNQGQPGRLYLMKCPIELYEYSQSLLSQDVDATAAALRGGQAGVNKEGQVDASQRYLKEMKAPLLTRKH